MPPDGVIQRTGGLVGGSESQHVEAVHLPTQGGQAWSGAAPMAAGEIHSDFERGFIRADVISYSDFITHGSDTAAREAGKLRSEGKEYVVSDGDVIHFKFNV